MSRAFVREDDQDRPDRPPEFAVSRHPNWVTKRGLALIEGRLAEIEAALSAGPAEAERARLERDRRYWTVRHATAEVKRPDPESDEVGFGSKVTFSRDGGKPETIELVGEDEADPAAGRISAFAPFAASLMEACAGDIVEAGPRARPIKVRIIAVENGLE